MGAEFEVTIIEDDTRLATLSHILCEEPTVVRASSTAFLIMLPVPPTSRLPSDYTLSRRVNNNIMCLPISSSVFPINGLDATVYSHLALPLRQPFPSEFALMLTIIHRLLDKRKLTYFVLFYATLSTVTDPDVDISTLLENFRSAPYQHVLSTPLL